MTNIKIRFNTEKEKVDNSLRPWRVLVNGQEHLAEEVKLYVASWTSVDEIEPGRIKWHISCEGEPHWNSTRTVCEIR
ncbi:MAG: hypothetical protein ABL958_07965 [Bdellovibrionia bacterium]